MKHIRQILLDKTALVRISVAETEGTAEEVALAKSRFENITTDEVEFLSIEEVGTGTDRFIGTIKLTGRDGFEFKQRWSPGDTVPVFNDDTAIDVQSLDDLAKIIVPGKYFVTDINELCLVITNTMTVEEIQHLLGYQFEPGELALKLSYLSVDCPIVGGTLPVTKVTVKPDGTVTDGTGMSVAAAGLVDGKFIANPHAPSQFITVTRTDNTPVFDSALDDVFKATFVGSYRQNEIITGTLNAEDKYQIDLDLSHADGEEVKLLTSAGLAVDKMTDVYLIEYIAENWTLAEFTPSQLIRVGHPFSITGTVSGDLGDMPWGNASQEPKIVVTEKGAAPVEFAFEPDGSFAINHTLTASGDMTVKFVCGLPEDLNSFVETYPVLAALTVDDLEFKGPAVSSETEVPHGGFTMISGNFASTDNLSIADTSVEVVVDDVKVADTLTDENGDLNYKLTLSNTDLTPVAAAVKFRFGAKESGAVNVTVKPEAQVPTKFNFIPGTDQGTLGDPVSLSFQVLDQHDRPIDGIEGTWQRPNGAELAWSVVGVGCTAEIPSPAGETESFVEQITLKTGPLTDTHGITWTKEILVPTTLAVTSNNPMTVLNNRDAVVTGTVTDQNGDLLVGAVVTAAYGATETTDTTITGGVFEFAVPYEDGYGNQSTVDLMFGDQVQATVTINWEEPRVLTEYWINPSYASVAMVNGKVSLRGECRDQFGDVIAKSQDIHYKSNDEVRPVVKSASNGTFTVQVTEDTAGKYVYTFGQPGMTETTATVTYNEPLVYSDIVLESGATSAVVGTPVELKLKTVDQNGNAIGNSNWTVQVGTDIPSRTEPSSALGIIDYTATATEAGEETYFFQGAGDGYTHRINWTLPAPVYQDIEYVSGATTAEVGETVKLVVRTIDQYGNPIGNKNVNLQHGSNPPSSFWRSDENGLSDWNVTGDEAGDAVYRFRGAAGDGYDHTITWTAAAPVYSNIVVSPDSETVGTVGGRARVKVTTVDQNGQPMADQTVVWSLAGGIPFPASRSDENGEIVYNFEGTEAGAAVYRFQGADQTVEHTVTWSDPA